MGGESKHPPEPEEPETPEPSEIVLELKLEWTNDDLVRDRLETIADSFLRPKGQVNFDLRAVTSVAGEFYKETMSHMVQRNVGRWIRLNARPSGVGKNTFFLNVTGYPITLRVDIEDRQSSPILTFRAIGR